MHLFRVTKTTKLIEQGYFVITTLWSHYSELVISRDCKLFVFVFVRNNILSSFELIFHMESNLLKIDLNFTINSKFFGVYEQSVYLQGLVFIAQTFL